jgi:hypothetical protein
MTHDRFVEIALDLIKKKHQKSDQYIDHNTDAIFRPNSDYYRGEVTAYENVISILETLDGDDFLKMTITNVYQLPEIDVKEVTRIKNKMMTQTFLIEHWGVYEHDLLYDKLCYVLSLYPESRINKQAFYEVINAVPSLNGGVSCQS